MAQPQFTQPRVHFIVHVTDVNTVKHPRFSLLSPHSNFTLIRNNRDGDLVVKEVGSNDVLDGVIFPADISFLDGDLDLARAFQLIEAMVAAPSNRTPNVVILTKNDDSGDLSAALELIRCVLLIVILFLLSHYG